MAESNPVSIVAYLFCIVLFYITINIFFSKEMSITDKGIDLGNRYYPQCPSSNVTWGFSTLSIIFKRKKFLSWKEIKSVVKKEMFTSVKKRE